MRLLDYFVGDNLECKLSEPQYVIFVYYLEFN